MCFVKQKFFEGHAGAIFAAAFDGEFLYTGSADKFVARWNVESGEQDKFSIRFNYSIYSIETIDNRYLIAGLSSGDLYVFDLLERKEIYFFQQHIKAIFAIKYNPEKNQLYVADADGNLSVWSTIDFKLLIYLPLDCGKIRNIDIDETGVLFVLSCQDSTFRIFESKGLNELITVDAHVNGSTAVLFHRNWRGQLITGGKDAHLKLWNWEKQKELKSIPAHNYSVYDLISLCDGKCFVSCSRDKTIKIWDRELNFMQRLDFKDGGHRHSVNRLVKLDEKRFASVSDDTKIIVWKCD